MRKWFEITNTKLFIVLGISVLWIIAGILIYEFIGSKHGPDGGLDSIANAIVYVFFWRIIIYGIPVLVSAVSIFLWLFQNHRKAFVCVIAAIIVCILASVVYNKCLKKHVNTPERVAENLQTYEEWYKEQKSRYGLNEKYTESDLICDYVHDTVYDALTEYRIMYSEDDLALRTEYVNAALEARCSEIPHVESWEYIPDIRTLIPPRGDGDNEFLLNNSELCTVAEHYKKELRTDHWYDRYQFKDSVIAEWYSWMPMCAVIYDDGTMDLVITTG